MVCVNTSGYRRRRARPQGRCPAPDGAILGVADNDGVVDLADFNCHPGVPVVRPTTLTDEDGRGLVVIKTYSNRWGVRRLSPHVKTVGCELLMLPIPHGGTG